jgi:hypothetical protein
VQAQEIRKGTLEMDYNWQKNAIYWANFDFIGNLLRL